MNRETDSDFKVWRAIAIGVISGAFIWTAVIYGAWRLFR
jgi:hypothetical protein